METIVKKDLTGLIMKGFRLAHKKVVERAKRDDEELIIADKAGQPIRVKARDLWVITHAQAIGRLSCD